MTVYKGLRIALLCSANEQFSSGNLGSIQTNLTKWKSADGQSSIKLARYLIISSYSIASNFR